MCVCVCVCVCVFVATDAGKCEEQFQRAIIPLRETETEGEKERPLRKEVKQHRRKWRSSVQEMLNSHWFTHIHIHTHTYASEAAPLKKPQLLKSMERNGYCVLKSKFIWNIQQKHLSISYFCALRARQLFTHMNGMEIIG